jgi:hypothetical protein
MISLTLKDTGAYLGTVDESDLQVLIDQLEEEHKADTDYYICLDTIDMLGQNGGSSHLIQLLQQAVGETDGVEIAWKKG